jgi:hypothetical protein
MDRDHSYITTLRPELRLVVLSAGPPSVDAELRELVMGERIDWRLVLELADLERATAILWRRIRGYAPASLDPSVREKFERMALVADFMSSYLEQRAGETLVKLGAVGIEGIVLKGVALAVSVYGSFFERPMGDIDLLVDPERADEGWNLAQEAGWLWDEARYPSTNYVGHAHLPPLLDTRGRILRLELHAALFVAGSPFVLSAQELKSRGREMPVGSGGGRAIVPCREHLLLHACIHFAWSHMMSFGTWRSLRDVVALTTAGIDWALFEEEARRNRAETCAYWTLRFTQRLAGGSFPAETMARLGRSTDSFWRGAAERHLEHELFPVGPRCPSHLLRRRLWEAAIQPGRAMHGTVRPWILDDVGHEMASPPGESSGVARRLAQLGEVWQYVRLLSGRAPV